MVENSVNKVPKGPKVLGVLSMVFSGLGIIGMVMIMIAAALPSGRSVQIESVEATKLIVFFLGACLGYMLAPVGGLLGIISMIIMLVKRSRKILWLPITGAAIGMFAFVGSIIATAGIG
ncbi:hypothetical protein B0O40_1834 [Ruminococcaceae bacterium R-25]|nr:hypothetical protein B0O40_1834 [Ruminococcaceae bacterium R-25]SUQ21698.1 hypothetical protein SAMN06297423_1834 [Oscillospiraceae bacterium]